MANCPRCGKLATVEREMFCAHPTCPLPLRSTLEKIADQNDENTLRRALNSQPFEILLR